MPQTSVLTPASSQNNGAPLFEMKEKFDLVLEELSLFSSIGKEAERPGGPETPRAGGRPPEDETAERGIGRLTSPAAKAGGRTEVEQDVRGHIRAVGRQPETTSSNVGFDCEQEVPLGLSHSSAEGEDSMYSTVKQKERTVTEDGSKQWLPAFMVLPFLNEQNRARRLEPLKTCVRPIRVGLSKRERPKQLHPYFK
ncbi:RAD51-associated protein 2-like [Anguilla anguilla]|uniref:RAD51-associated protein 2-like n=1 Tax=Anguilla anguilla TaxID=7936 RepID=UPI0015AD47EE|nr:RAD51-associated protein 2-like [Anguilla anguilla]